VSPWERLLEQPGKGSHYVQLYAADDGSRTASIGRYLWEGLRLGEGVLVVASLENQEAFSRRLQELGADVGALTGSRQLVFLNAHETLSRFMRNGQPDWAEFQKVIRGAMRQVRFDPSKEGCRAYGEMVGILWKARQFAAAIRLEQYWNRLLEQSSFSLYCAYAIDIFGRDYAVANLEELLCTHTHLVPAQPDGTLEAALNRALDEILGAPADELRIRIKSHPRHEGTVMPNAENIVFWLHRNLPDRAGEILALAQRHYHGLHA